MGALGALGGRGLKIRGDQMVCGQLSSRVSGGWVVERWLLTNLRDVYL